MCYIADMNLLFKKGGGWEIHCSFKKYIFEYIFLYLALIAWLVLRT